MSVKIELIGHGTMNLEKMKYMQVEGDTQRQQQQVVAVLINDDGWR